MVTFVVSLFLPYTVDFHEYDDTGGRLRRIPSSRSASTLNLEGLGRRQSTLSLLDDVDNAPSSATPSRPLERPSLMQRLSRVKIETLNSLSQESKNRRSWSRTDTTWGDRMSPELLDEPNHRMSRSLVSEFLSATSYNPASTYKIVSPSHSRKSSLAFILPDTQTAVSTEDESFKTFDGSSWTIEDSILANGGVVNAVRKATKCNEADTIWIGTLEGDGTDRVSASRKDDIADKLAHEYNALVLFVPDTDRDGHYEHFCKVILWPVLHYHMPNNLKGKAYEDDSWRYYYNVNRRFADKIIDNYKQGDVVWIQDYHLMLVPKMVRDRLPDAEIGFFLHTAFPSSELFRCIAPRKDLLEGMLGAGLIGLQTAEYVRHFLQTCSRVLLTEIEDGGVYVGDRFVRIIHQPVGIVREALDQERENHESGIHDYMREMQNMYKDKILIVARDKLDTIRGMRQKLLAYELFLKDNPDLSDKVVLLQIATSTTELIEYHTSVHDIVQRINDAYSTLEHTPLEFLSQDMPYASYVAMISVADVLLNTSLREGMGLTAQEFIHCQDGTLGPKKHGVVVLSEFTGTSSLFGGSDLTCNPWDTRGTAEQIARAVRMSPEEKSQRWNKLRKIVDHHTGAKWWSDLQAKLHESHAREVRRSRHHTPRLDLEQLSRSYASASRRLLLLDNEGTLTSSPTNLDLHKRVCKLLASLTADPANIVYITSSLSPTALEDLYGSNSSLGLIAENGHFTHQPHSKPGSWLEADPASRVRRWKTATKPFLQQYLERIEGATLVERWTSFAIDYSAAARPAAAEVVIGELLTHVNEACRALRVRAVPHPDRTVTVEGVECSKANAAKRQWDDLGWTAAPFDFVLVAGRERSVEGLFHWANALEGVQCFTVSLGSGMTDARATLAGGPGALCHVLGKLVGTVAEKLGAAVDRRRETSEGLRLVIGRA